MVDDSLRAFSELDTFSKNPAFLQISGVCELATTIIKAIGGGVQGVKIKNWPVCCPFLTENDGVDCFPKFKVLFEI